MTVPNDHRDFVEFMGRLKETQTLLAVSQALSLRLEAPEAMRRVAREVALAFGADMVGAYAPDPTAPNALLPIAGYHVPEHLRAWFQRTPLSISASPAIEMAWRTRTSVWTSDATTDATWAPTVRELPPHAALFAPTVAGHEVVGGLFLIWWEAGRVFTEAELGLMSGVAAQVGLALENRALAREMSERLLEAEIVADVAKSVTTSLDQDTVLSRVVDRARELCRADLAVIGLEEPGRHALVFRHRAGVRFRAYDDLRIERGQGVAGTVWATGRPLRTADRLHDARFAPDESLRAEGLRGMLAVPIRSGGSVAGVLVVGSRAERRFTDAEERALERVAEHAAIAIQNARLFAAEHASRAEAEAAGRRFRALIEYSEDGLTLRDATGCILYASPALCRMLGYDVSELLGRTGLRLIHPEDRPAAEALFARTLGEPETPHLVQIRWRRHDGVYRWLEGVSVNLLHDPAVSAIVTNSRDITEKKLAEEALRQSQKMEAVGRLAGGIAHDFNNLLTVISGRSELLLHRLRVDDPVRRDVELIKRVGERAATLTRQLLAFSRKQVLQTRVLRLDAIVADLEPMLQRLIGEHIEMITTIAPEVGHVRADPAQIEQVVLNLVVNARDAMAAGGRVTIDVADVDLDAPFAAANPSASPGPHVVLSVSDTGTGIPAEVQPRIFEPFFTTKDQGKGTGLGLAMVYGIVKQHEGTITVESQEGRGTTFRVYLRRVPGAASPEPARPSAQPAHGPGTILLVEDEDDVRGLAREILVGDGFDVLEAATPGEAVRAAERHAGRIDLVVTDVVMPEMSGRELAARLVESRPETKVLYISGYSEDAIARHGVLDPGTTLLAKPFSPDDLRRTVTMLLE